MRKVRVGVLVSGRGSNLRALLAAAADRAYPAEVAMVVSDRAGAGGLAHAADFGVASRIVLRGEHESRAAFEAALTESLAAAEVELVCLAGFMRVLSAAFVERWRDRLLNIHPSLLPAFPGLDTHERALTAGVRFHGCTVHLVRAEVDRGPILGQGAVPVLPDDTAESLAARVLAVEHRLYPACLAAFAEGRIGLTGDAVGWERAPETLLYGLPGQDG